jgi:hypothetical protein
VNSENDTASSRKRQRGLDLVQEEQQQQGQLQGTTQRIVGTGRKPFNSSDAASELGGLL